MEKKIKQLIDSSEIISFDIFDTLILRYVDKPQYIFKLIQEEYLIEDKYDINFSNERILAEERMRERFSDREITLEEIYNEIKAKKILNTNDINKLIEIEKQIEKRYTILNRDLKEVYDYCINSKKRIIVTSDMYLDRITIEEILKKEDIVYDKLYLSSELGYSKNKGDLFDYIVKQENCNVKDILHIGDNLHSDYRQARCKGLKSFHYKNKSKYSEFESSKYEKIHQCIVEKYNYEKLTTWEKIGFEKVGIMYYAFIKWLITEIEKEKIEHVYFFSRDGYIMKEIYDIFNEGNTLPQSTYFYASRRAINIPSIKEVNNDTLKILKTSINKTSFESFLIKIGLNKYQIIDTLEMFNIQPSQIINSKEDNDLIDRMIYHNEKIIINNSEKERVVLERYIRQEKMDKFSKIAVVDIGWHGTMQKSLSNILKSLDIENEMLGFYLGTNKCENTVNNSMRGYLYCQDKPLKNKRILRAFNALIEELFIAPHGSVVGYKFEDGVVKPIFEEFEYDEKQYKILRDIQTGAVKYIKVINQLINNHSNLSIDKEVALRPIEHLIFNPTLKEAQSIGKLYHFDYVKNFNAKPSEKLIGYAIKPRKFIKDYKACLWKIGFFRQITKVNLNSIFKFIYFVQVHLSERNK